MHAITIAQDVLRKGCPHIHAKRLKALLLATAQRFMLQAIRCRIWRARSRVPRRYATVSNRWNVC
jgi:hypothetical protein